MVLGFTSKLDFQPIYLKNENNQTRAYMWYIQWIQSLDWLKFDQT